MTKKIIEVLVNGCVQKIHCDDLAKMHYWRKKKTPPVPNFDRRRKNRCKKVVDTDTPQSPSKI